MNVAAISDIGISRDLNEDFYYCSEDPCFPVFIVADGLGGHKAGEIASEYAVEIVLNNLKKTNFCKNRPKELEKLLIDGVNKANTFIHEKASENKDYRGMGTTITVACINDDKLVIAHVGDSRAYLFRGDKILQLTEDHTLVNELYSSGQLTENEIKRHPQRNMITRAVGTEPIIEVDTISIELETDDLIVLCTDGLTNGIDEKTLKKLLQKINLQKACFEAVELAIKNGSKDNITLIAIRYDEVKK